MAAPPAALLARAFDPAVEPPDDATSERILDSALALAAASGLRHLTIDDIAAKARVGRMTVYRRFGDRARLIEALTVREARRCLAELDAAAPVDAPIDAQVAEGFAVSLRLAREHPLLERLARVEPEAVLETLSADGGAVFAMARGFLAQRLRASRRAGVLGRSVDVDQAAELLVRLAFSFVLIPETALPIGDDVSARRFARRMIAPLVDG